jgi:hypothetical protein
MGCRVSSLEMNKELQETKQNNNDGMLQIFYNRQPSKIAQLLSITSFICGG